MNLLISYAATKLDARQLSAAEMECLQVKHRVMDRIWVAAAAALVALGSLGSARAGPTLDTVKGRGKLICAVCRTRWEDEAVCPACLDRALDLEPNPQLIKSQKRQAARPQGGAGHPLHQARRQQQGKSVRGSIQRRRQHRPFSSRR